MSELTEKQAATLFQEYLSDKLTDERALILLNHLKQNEDFEWKSYHNLYVDYLLHHRARSGLNLDVLEIPVEDDSSRYEHETENLSNDTFQAELNCLEFLRQYPSPAQPSLRFRPHREIQGSGGTHVWLSRIGRRLNSFTKATSAGMAAIGVIFLVSYLFYSSTYRETSPGVVAHMTGFDEVVWGDCIAPVCPGDPVETDVLRIKQGTVSLKMLGGASIVLEGPAELRFRDESSLDLVHGYLSADIPPQQKIFHIETPRMKIDVLGTAFWVKASEENSEVHLIRGSLELRSPEFKLIRLGEGEAFSLPKFGASSRLKALLDGFVSAETCVSKTETVMRKREEVVRKTVDADPNLLLHFDFQQFGKQVFNRSVLGKNSIPSAQVMGCYRTRGEKTGDGAIVFRRKTDSLHLLFPKPTSALTMACRLKLRSDVHYRAALLMSDKLTKGAIQWFIAQNRVPMLNVSNGPHASFSTYKCTDKIPVAMIGAWVHLAVTFDPAGRQVRWYIDGGHVATIPIIDPLPITIGDATIGSWSEANDDLWKEGGFDLDEMMVFDRVLDKDEIHRLASSRSGE